MIRSAVTVSLVEQARGGPFVFWDGLQPACSQAASLGFDAIEVFAPGPDAVDVRQLLAMLEKSQLVVAAVGTGAGMLKHGLTLTDADQDRRRRAREFIRSMIDFGSQIQAPAIIGSMQGRWAGSVSREQALGFLADALEDLGAHAEQCGVRLIYEPLNRYETNLITELADGVAFLESLKTRNVRLLADLFHMNIEESDIPQAIRRAGKHIGHVHFVDSNRRAAGFGHLELNSIARALHDIAYDGFLSAEALPWPEPSVAAQQTMVALRQHFPQIGR